MSPIASHIVISVGCLSTEGLVALVHCTSSHYCIVACLSVAVIETNYVTNIPLIKYVLVLVRVANHTHSHISVPLSYLGKQVVINTWSTHH